MEPAKGWDMGRALAAVPPARVARAFALVAAARTLLVLGSSLTVMSGRRFVLRAVRDGIRVAIVNRGVTRGEPYADLFIDAPLGAVLPNLAVSDGQVLI